jgi:hypothetical protein
MISSEPRRCALSANPDSARWIDSQSVVTPPRGCSSFEIASALRSDDAQLIPGPYLLRYALSYMAVLSMRFLAFSAYAIMRLRARLGVASAIVAATFP